MTTEKILYYRDAIINGYLNVKKNKAELNRINFFPIPDGDTGSNLVVTIKGGVENINGKKYKNFRDLFSDFKIGLINNSSGNSGSIFTQIIIGFFDSYKGHKKNTFNVKLFVSGIESSVKKVYSGIENPIEGTIITVLTDIKNEAIKFINNKKIIKKSISILMDIILIVAKKSVKNTKKTLKENYINNVVDSGALGFFYFIEGIFSYKNKWFENKKIKKYNSNIIHSSSVSRIDYSKPKLGYCTEFTIQTKTPTKREVILKEIKNNNINSLVIINQKNFFKIHCHANEPHKILESCYKFGEFIRIKIDNMTIQSNDHYERIINEKEAEKFQFGQDIFIITKDIGWYKIILKSCSKNVFLYEEKYLKNLKLILKRINKLKYNKYIFIIDNNKYINFFNKIKKEFSQHKIKMLIVSDPAEIILCFNYFDKNSNQFEKMFSKMKKSISNSNIYNLNKINEKYFLYKNNQVIFENNSLNNIISDFKKILPSKSELLSVFKNKSILKKDDKILLSLLKKKLTSLEINIEGTGNIKNLYTFIIE